MTQREAGDVREYYRIITEENIGSSKRHLHTCSATARTTKAYRTSTCSKDGIQEAHIRMRSSGRPSQYVWTGIRPPTSVEIARRPSASLMAIPIIAGGLSTNTGLGEVNVRNQTHQVRSETRRTVSAGTTCLASTTQNPIHYSLRRQMGADTS